MRKALYLLGDLAESDILWMAREGTVRQIGDGETLIVAGRPVDAFYVVIDGAFRVVHENGVEVARLGAGDVLGEMSLVEKQPPSASVVASAPSKVLGIPQATIVGRIADDPPFAARFYRALAVFLSDRLREASTRIAAGPEAGGLAQFEDEHELDEGLLDNIHIAGDRMRRLTELLESGSGAAKRE